MLAPCNLSAEPTTLPCSMFIVAPIARSPDWCMSSGREPMASPPGRATCARRQRPINGPRTQTEARSRPTAGKSAWWDSSAGVVMVTVSPASDTSAPSPVRTSAISGTSRISGQFEITVVPSASNAAAMSFRTLFLAPATRTLPESRAPPVTRKRSTVGTLTGQSAGPVRQPDTRPIPRRGRTAHDSGSARSRRAVTGGPRAGRPARSACRCPAYRSGLLTRRRRVSPWPCI
jgi:hypothetical protein